MAAASPEVELDVVNAAGSRRRCCSPPSSSSCRGQRCVLSILHDVTDRRREEETLRLAQKMESLGVLAGGVAHDFNNLLAVMLGHTSLALAKLPAASPVRDHVEKAVEAAERPPASPARCSPTPAAAISRSAPPTSTSSCART